MRGFRFDVMIQTADVFEVFHESFVNATDTFTMLLTQSISVPHLFFVQRL